MVKIALPEDLRSMEGRIYIHDAEQGRQGLLGVEDARIASNCGNEHTSIEANKRDPKRG